MDQAMHSDTCVNHTWFKETDCEQKQNDYSGALTKKKENDAATSLPQAAVTGVEEQMRMSQP